MGRNEMNVDPSYSGLEIAIIGMSGKFPGAESIEAFWLNLINSRESVTFFTDEELEKAGVPPELLTDVNYIKAGSILDDIEYFDASFFGYTPREAQIMNPQTRKFYECAFEALEDAGYSSESYEGLIGVYAGASVNPGWEFRTAFSGKADGLGQFAVTTLANKDSLSTRVSYKLNLKGPSISLRTACSTSLVAVHLGCRALLTKECDIALAGGISIQNLQRIGYVYQDGLILSPDGHCRSFDNKASGTIFGDGVGVVVLKKLNRAMKERDHIYALIKGSAINNDGIRKVGYTAPSVEGQTDVITTAQKMAGVKPESISFIEAHGTGTKLGDTIEIEALKMAFRSTKKNFCAIGSAKSNVGHLDAAAGICGLIKAVLALKYRLIPPSLHFESPNQEIDFDNSPFFVNKELKKWVDQRHPLRAGVSSFGFGGTNAHVILEEPPSTEVSLQGRVWKLILLSARSASALDQVTSKVVEFLRKNTEINLADMAYTLQIGRQVYKYRKMAICSSVDETAAVLSNNRSGKVLSSRFGDETRPVFFMFPGLGSQYVNMGHELYETEPVFQNEMDHCFDILRSITDVEFRKMLFPGTRQPIPDIKRIDIAQIVVFILEYALARLLIQWGIIPSAMIGYSFGEYVAACIAGVFSLEDALELVVSRGKLLQRIPPGAMISVPLTRKQLCPLLSDGLALAIDNGESCVVAGSNTEVYAFEKRMKDSHYICIRMTNVMAIHSSLVEPILVEFEEKVGRIRLSEPQIPYISNVTGQWITADQARDPEYWASHLRQTVLFSDGLSELLKESNSIFIEIGPGGDLSKLVHRYLEKDSTSRIINLIRPPKKKISDAYYLHNQIGKLWLYGQQIDWHRYYSAEKRYRISLPTYPFERQRYWIDGNSIPASMGPMSPRNTAGDLGKGIYIPLWKPSVLSMRQHPQGTADPSGWLLFMHRDSLLGSKMADRLEGEGREVIRVLPGTRFHKRDEYTFTMNPCKENHYRRLMDGLREMKRLPTHIIHLWSVIEMAADQSESDWIDQVQGLGIYSMQFLIGAIELQGYSDVGKIKITVVTSKMQRIPGQEMGYPEKATLLGIVNAVSGKYPYIECRSIDIVASNSSTRKEAKLINQLTWEVTSPSADEPQVAWRGDDRLTLGYEPLPAKPKEISTGSTSTLKEGNVYLITGGFKGIGSVLARLLARRRGVKLILIQWSRTGAKEPQFKEKTQIVKQLENLGASVLALKVDLNKGEQIKRAVSYGQKKFGSISGVIHQPHLEDSAGKKTGMVDVKKVNDLSSNLANVMALEDIFRDRDLDFFVSCSTSTDDFSIPDPISKAAVNAFLELNACYKSPGNRFRTVSIAWPDFKAAESDRVLEKAEDVFQLILDTSLSRVFVGFEAGDRDDSITGLDPSKEVASADTLYGRPELSTEYVAPTGDVESRLTEVYQNFLGIEKIGILDDFLELGIDSLKTINLGIEIFNALNVRIPLAHLFDLANIKEMAEYITNSMSEETPVTDDTGRDVLEVSTPKAEAFVVEKSWDVAKISKSMESPENLLMTGITGFLGVHVLRELIEKTDTKVFCLVRADMLDDTVKRAKEIWDFYFDRPLDEYLGRKLFFYKGDLTQPRLGMDETSYNDLTDRIDSVVHCAADVRHYGRYENFKRTNVEGTRRVLDFCFHGSEKKMHYVSTIAIMGHPTESINFKESDLDIGQNLDQHVYSKSKFEAEKLVYRARHEGLKASIYRIGNLVGRLTDGFFQKNIETNYLYNHIKAIIMLKKFPSSLNEVTFEMAPIDICSRSLVNLVLLKDAVGYNYHLLNPNNLTFKNLFQYINDYGYFIETVDLETFSNQIYAEIRSESFRNEIEISRIFYLLRGHDGNREGVDHSDVRVTIDSTFTVEVLKKAGFNWCELDYSFISKMLEHCINVGYIKSPDR